MGGIEKSELEEMTKEFVDRKNHINTEINELKNNSITEQDLNRFIEALKNIFEHISNMQYKGKNGISEADMLHLIKLTTFELKIKASKELDIELFEGLKKAFYGIGNPKGFDVGTFKGYLRGIDLGELKNFVKLLNLV